MKEFKTAEIIERIEKKIENMDPETVVYLKDITRRIKTAEPEVVASATAMLLKKYGIGYIDDCLN